MKPSQLDRDKPDEVQEGDCTNGRGERKEGVGGKKVRSREFIVSRTASAQLPITLSVHTHACTHTHTHTHTHTMCTHTHTAHEEGSVFGNKELIPASCLQLQSVGPTDASSQAGQGRGQRAAKMGRSRCGGKYK